MTAIHNSLTTQHNALRSIPNGLTTKHNALTTKHNGLKVCLNALTTNYNAFTMHWQRVATHFQGTTRLRWLFLCRVFANRVTFSLTLHYAKYGISKIHFYINFSFFCKPSIFFSSFSISFRFSRDFECMAFDWPKNPPFEHITWSTTTSFFPNENVFINFTKPENKIPWLFTDFDKNWDFPWPFAKFPDFSLTLKIFWFSLTFPWPWQPCLLTLTDSQVSNSWEMGVELRLRGDLLHRMCNIISV